LLSKGIERAIGKGTKPVGCTKFQSCETVVVDLRDSSSFKEIEGKLDNSEVMGWVLLTLLLIDNAPD
jgi:hypothetical protein